jgi:hypothetical protein
VIEVFVGNPGDPSTAGNQITKLKECFGLKRVVMIGNRGIITRTRIEGDCKPTGIDWITALRAPQTAFWRGPYPKMLLATPPDILAEATSYARIMMLSMPVTFTFILAISMTRSVGDTVTPLV